MRTGTRSLCAATIAVVLVALALFARHTWRDRQDNRALARLSERIGNKDAHWREDDAKGAVLTPAELQAIEGQVRGNNSARYQITIGIATGALPSVAGRQFSQTFRLMEEIMSRELHGQVAIGLALCKLADPQWASMAQGQANVLLLSAANFFAARTTHPSLTPVAFETSPNKVTNKCVLFVRADSRIAALSHLRGKSLALPDPDSSISVPTKALLAKAGILKEDLRQQTDFSDRVPTVGRAVAGEQETIFRVQKGEFDAGATSVAPFMLQGRGTLREIASFPTFPNVFVARSDQLAPKVIEALRHALVAEFGAVEVTDSQLNELRETINMAARFEGQATNTMDAE